VELSAEWKLLLACAKVDLFAEEQQRIAQKLASAVLDWDFIAKTSCEHGIGPLVYHNFQKSGIANQVRPSAAESLRGAYYGNAARNALLFAELQSVLTRMQEFKIDVIVLKGAALAGSVYPQKTLRTMTDIDLLVRNPSLPLVEKLLLQKGYRPDRRNDGWWEHHYHWGFVKITSSMKIHFEIHWHIDYPTTPFNIDIEGMWKNAVRARVAGVDVLVLSPEDLLLHLCQHACKHKLIGVRPLCDIRETIRHYKRRIRWGEIETRAAEWRITPQVCLTLRLAKDLLGAEVPQAVLNAMRPDDFNDGLLDLARGMVLNRATENLFQDDARMVFEFYSKCSSLKGAWAALTEPFSRKAIAKRYLLPSASKRIYFYYPVLLRDLCVRYFFVLWHMVRDRQHTILSNERKPNDACLEEWLAPRRR